MKQYLIVGDTLKETMYCFDYMGRVLRDKISNISERSLTIVVDEYHLRFMSKEQYFRYGRIGYRGEALNSRYVERLLDTYKVLARI